MARFSSRRGSSWRRWRRRRTRERERERQSERCVRVSTLNCSRFCNERLQSSMKATPESVKFNATLTCRSVSWHIKTPPSMVRSPTLPRGSAHGSLAKQATRTVALAGENAPSPHCFQAPNLSSGSCHCECRSRKREATLDSQCVRSIVTFSLQDLNQSCISFGLIWDGRVL